MIEDLSSFLIKALSVMLSENNFTPLTFFIFCKKASSALKNFPVFGVICKSGSMALYKLATTPVKPFIADKIITNAPVVNEIAIMLIQLMILIALFDFFEIK